MGVLDKDFERKVISKFQKKQSLLRFSIFPNRNISFSPSGINYVYVSSPFTVIRKTTTISKVVNASFLWNCSFLIVSPLVTKFLLSKQTDKLTHSAISELKLLRSNFAFSRNLVSDHTLASYASFGEKFRVFSEKLSVADMQRNVFFNKPYSALFTHAEKIVFNKIDKSRSPIKQTLFPFKQTDAFSKDVRTTKAAFNSSNIVSLEIIKRVIRLSTVVVREKEISRDLIGQLQLIYSANLEKIFAENKFYREILLQNSLRQNIRISKTRLRQLGISKTLATNQIARRNDVKQVFGEKTVYLPKLIQVTRMKEQIAQNNLFRLELVSLENMLSVSKMFEHRPLSLQINPFNYQTSTYFSRKPDSPEEVMLSPNLSFFAYIKSELLFYEIVNSKLISFNQALSSQISSFSEELSKNQNVRFLDYWNKSVYEKQLVAKVSPRFRLRLDRNIEHMKVSHAAQEHALSQTADFFLHRTFPTIISGDESDSRSREELKLSIYGLLITRAQTEEYLYSPFSIWYLPGSSKFKEGQLYNEILRRRNYKFSQRIVLGNQLDSFSSRRLFRSQNMSFVNQWKAMHRRRGVSSYFRLSSSPKMMPLDVLPKERVLTSAYSSSGFELPQHIRFRNERALLEYVQKQTKIINETKEEVAKKQPFVSEPQINLPSIDMNRLVDQIYELIERKARIERERRGL